MTDIGLLNLKLTEFINKLYRLTPPYSQQSYANIDLLTESDEQNLQSQQIMQYQRNPNLGVSINGLTQRPPSIQPYPHQPLNIQSIPGGSPLLQGAQYQFPIGVPQQAQQFGPSCFNYQLGPPLLPQNLFTAFHQGVRGAPYGLPYGAVGGSLLPSYLGYQRLDPYSSSKSTSSPNKNSSFREQFQPGRVTKQLPVIDTTMANEKIYCVICQQSYFDSERQEHIKKHQRNFQTYQPIKQVRQKQSIEKPRPIIEPRQYNVQPASPAPNNSINNQQNIQYNNQPNQDPRFSINSQNNNQMSIIDSIPMHNQNSNINQAPELRYSRNTFISDQPSPAILPRNQLYGRETIQSNQFRGSQQDPYSYANIYQQLYNNVGGGLPKRDTVQSQDSGYNPIVSSNQNKLLAHQSVMSPIREQSQHRLTASQQNEQSQRISGQQINPARSTLDPNITNQIEKGTASQSQRVNVNTANDFNFDDFEAQTMVQDTHIIPREGRKTINNDIPISQIINDRLAH